MEIKRFYGTRRDDWPERLDAYILETTHRPWGWGRKDCVMWALGAVKAMTGKDPARGIRGKYRTEKQAFETLEILGCKTVHQALIRCLGKSKTAGQAKRGDVVITTIDGAQFAGVCIGQMSVFGQDPLIQLPTLTAKRAWSIG